MTEDGSTPLRNARHEAFAQTVARGQVSDMKAYAAAGYSQKAANQNATVLRGNAGIKARIAWLQTQAADSTVLSIAEKRAFLARVVRAKMSTEPWDSDLWQEIVTTEDGEKRKLPDKLQCIKADNDLAPEVESAVHTIVIRIGGGDGND